MYIHKEPSKYNNFYAWSLKKGNKCVLFFSSNVFFTNKKEKEQKNRSNLWWNRKIIRSNQILLYSIWNLFPKKYFPIFRSDKDIRPERRVYPERRRIIIYNTTQSMVLILDGNFFILRTHEGKWVFSGENIRFVTALDVEKNALNRSNIRYCA